MPSVSRRLGNCVLAASLLSIGLLTDASSAGAASPQTPSSASSTCPGTGSTPGQPGAAIGQTSETLHPLKTESLPGGGFATVFPVAGTSEIQYYAVPPATFKPASASNAELALFGFPPRPQSPAALAQWTDAMTAWHRTVPAETLTAARTTAPPSGRSTSRRSATGGVGIGVTSSNWSGYELQGAAGEFSAISGTYVEPTTNAASACASNNQTATTWVGLGTGTSTQLPLVQDGVQNFSPSGVSPSSHQAWWEQFPENVAQAMPLTVSPGDKIYTSTNYDSFVPLICSGVSASYGVHFYVQDMTSGASASAGLCTNNADESTAEWITERSGLCPNNNPNNCGLSQLAQFSPLAWKSTGVTDAAQSNTLASLTENPISFSMTSDGSSTGDILALPGTINSSGGFTDTWYACS